MLSSHYIEIGHHQVMKNRMQICGDTFISQRIREEGRVISILADGLGSGVKAAVLSTLTSTMAARFMSSDITIERAAEIIMKTLPICDQRKIGYSTFTISDIRPNGEVMLIEYDNPDYILIRQGESLPIKKQKIELLGPKLQPVTLSLSKFKLEPEDRLILFSDGISQAGIGNKKTPLGQGRELVIDSIKNLIRRTPKISARSLSERLVEQALLLDEAQAKDDITCATIYVRHPRKTLILTGPPFDEKHDSSLANMAKDFDGKKIICGGTTARILSRELNLPITMNLDLVYHNVPPTSKMAGFDLITEGTITLSKVYSRLEKDELPLGTIKDPIDELIIHLLDSDLISFMVGTKINVAHHDPSLPEELEIRRNVIKSIARILESKHLKEVSVNFI